MQETPWRRAGVSAVAVVVFLLAWRTLPRALGVSAQTLPTPVDLGRRLASMASHEGLGNHLLVTFSEIWRGVLIGLAAGVVLALVFAASPLVEKLVMPVVVVVQVTPKIAIAPLLVLWMGLGSVSKVFLVALVTFFPTLVNTLMALRSISGNVRQLSRLLALTRWQRFTKIELPSIVPGVVTGMRLGCLAGVTAAVIGEIIGAKAGLGYLVIQSQESGDVAQGLVAVLVLAFLGLLLWLGTGYLQARAERVFAA